ncbi:MAG: shikimate dehydrogenase [Gammaproteobacteria bacterium]|nr:shikimate dehydrogenase [Gammaproteobacteria bacterium]NIR97584.1 shikimate dehydrogenase [Gammaproteobacteria bacterium]NIV20167.1 shikimate dehydrogenase [Gammaproteobacteria bacterium]
MPAHDTPPDRYAVMGNPIAHSKSPRIHRLFAEQTGQRLSYEAVLVPTDGFAQAVEEFQRSGGRGLNVTVPFKQEAYRLVGRHSARAELAGAVNTIAFADDGSRFGDNTDGTGLVRDLVQNCGVELSGRAVLVIGAGGAVRGVLGPLLEQGPERLVIANRTASRAVELAERVASLGPISGCGFDALPGETFDVAINGTPASLQGEVPPLPPGLVSTEGCVYDMAYADTPTPFVCWGLAQGVTRSMDGLGMLVEQAAESFHIWRGVRPFTAPVIAALRR